MASSNTPHDEKVVNQLPISAPPPSLIDENADSYLLRRPWWRKIISITDTSWTAYFIFLGALATSIVLFYISIRFSNNHPRMPLTTPPPSVGELAESTTRLELRTATVTKFVPLVTRFPSHPRSTLLGDELPYSNPERLADWSTVSTETTTATPTASYDRYWPSWPTSGAVYPGRPFPRPPDSAILEFERLRSYTRAQSHTVTNKQTVYTVSDATPTQSLKKYWGSEHKDTTFVTRRRDLQTPSQMPRNSISNAEHSPISLTGIITSQSEALLATLSTLYIAVNDRIVPVSKLTPGDWATLKRNSQSRAEYLFCSTLENAYRNPGEESGAKVAFILMRARNAPIRIRVGAEERIKMYRLMNRKDWQDLRVQEGGMEQALQYVLLEIMDAIEESISTGKWKRNTTAAALSENRAVGNEGVRLWG